MSEESEAAKESAKAMQEVAKTGRALIEPATDLGRWVGRVLGTFPEDLFGLAFGDYMAHARLRRLAGYQQRTEEILRDRGVDDPRPMNPKLAIPALIAASEEGDETIQELWARLFANAADPTRNIWLNERLIDALRKMDGADPHVFSQLADLAPGRAVTIDTLTESLNFRRTVVWVSLSHLRALDINMGDPNYERASLAPLGLELKHAVEL